MRRNRLFIILSMTAVLILGAISCATSEHGNVTGDWNGVISERNGVRVIENPADPIFEDLTLELEEDLRIGGEEENTGFVRVGGLSVDAEGAVYIADAGNHRIQKFGSDGSFRATFGRQGQGPGEFDRLSAFFVRENGRIYAVDGMRLQRFDPSGVFEKSVTLKNRLSAFLVFPDETILGVETRNTEQGRRQILVRIDPAGGDAEELGDYSDVAPVDQRDEGRTMRVVIVHGLNARLLLARGPGSAVFSAFAAEYEIQRRGTDGAPDFIIQKAEDPVPVSEAEKERIVSSLLDNLVVRNRNIREDIVRQGCRFPSHRPFFSDLLVDDRGRIFTLRTRSPLVDDETRILDVFDTDGRYLCRAVSPVRPWVIRHGFIYEIHENEDTGDITLRRHLIKNWNAVPGGEG